MVMIGTPFGSHDETAQPSLDHPGTVPGNDPRTRANALYKEEQKHKKEARSHTQQRPLTCFEALLAVIMTGPILVLPAPR